MDTTAVIKISNMARIDTAKAKRHYGNKTCPASYHFEVLQGGPHPHPLTLWPQAGASVPDICGLIVYNL